jgi:hypothetical protein
MELTAWVVLVTALAVFLAALVGLPYLGLQFAQRATVPQTAVVESKRGAVVLRSTSGDERVLKDGEQLDGLPEGSSVTTLAGARAFMRLFDNSVVHLRPGTTVELREMRRPRFDAGGSGRTVRLAARPDGPGPAALTVGATSGKVELVVDTPHGQVRLGPEAQARLQITPDELSVQDNDGAVTVEAAGKAVTLGFDQRTDVPAGRPPGLPTAAEKNVVLNPDFGAPAGTDPWKPQFEPPTRASTSSRSVLPDGRTVVRFHRGGTAGRPGDIYYRQVLGEDVADARHLGVTADLRVLAQELTGGGIGASEFPVIVSLVYRDEEDNADLRWETAFYSRPLDPGDSTSAALSPGRTQQVSEGEWYHYDSGNLLDRSNPRGFAALGLPPPVQLTRIEVKASGHDLDSEVDDVGVWVK